MRQKIVELNILSEIISELRTNGKVIGLCHGCFDLMHPGHIKHFEAAKSACDVLIVTVTPDRYVNKGPGRPIFNEQLRMESISSLECVDYVSLNLWETAVNTIHAIKPNFYFKGQDYQDFSKDITKGILSEAEAVIEVGGKLEITDEVQFSSSALINAHLSPYNDTINAYRTILKSKFDADALIETIESLNKLKVLVLGDTIIDEYHYCRPLGKSSKSPTISSIFLNGYNYAGGVLAIANHLEQFAGEVQLFTVLGEKDSNEELILQRLAPSIKRNFFYRKDSPTPTKRRYLDRYLDIKLFEVTFMNDNYLEEDLEEALISSLNKKLPEVDLVIIADFGHGTLTPKIINYLKSSEKYLAVNAQTNSNNFGFNYITKYPRANFISIDENEIRLPFGDKFGDLENLCQRLSKACNCPFIQVTLGQRGSILLESNNFTHAPALAKSVKDSVGAGDAVLSITSLLSASKVNTEIVAFIGNCMGALAVQILGNEHPVYKKDLLKFISHFLK